MKPLVFLCLAVAALTVIVPVVIVSIFAFDAHFETERRINDALQSRYAGRSVTELARSTWKQANEMCIEIAIRPLSTGEQTRRVIMVSGDLDGGTWSAGREFASMRACEVQFYRG
jgi:hypothetical protein